MILVDTSVWVDHLRTGDAAMAALLAADRVCMHPFVLGEIACGTLRKRAQLLALLSQMQPAVLATPDEVLAFIDAHALHGRGIGYVDAHLLAATALTPGSRLWTRDQRLAAAAAALGLAYGPAHTPAAR